MIESLKRLILEARRKRRTRCAGVVFTDFIFRIAICGFHSASEMSQNVCDFLNKKMKKYATEV